MAASSGTRAPTPGLQGKVAFITGAARGLGAMRAAIEGCLARMGQLDILVNNAGAEAALRIDALWGQDWLRAIGTSLNGSFLLTKQAAAHMRSRGGGDIIKVVSTAAKRAGPNASSYHASKWGRLGRWHALHAELHPHGIGATAVQTVLPMQESAWP